jgi:hypothetical protein
MWLPGLRTFLGSNRPLSKNSLRSGCCTIFWSFANQTIESSTFRSRSKVRGQKRQNARLEPRRRQNAPGVDSQGFGVRLTGFGQLRNSPAAGLSPGEASHDCFPQVDAKGLDFNAFFQGLAGFSSTKSVAHASALDISFSKNLQN